MKFILILVHFV